ncbi:MAG TPA: hypothetical protein VFS39_16310 [Nitrospira sp.]|nr:hypothetical protein [Nitrospira sp.]
MMTSTTWCYGASVLCLSTLLLGSGATIEAGMNSGRQTGMDQNQGQDPTQSQASRQEGSRWEKITGTLKKMKPVPLANSDQQNLLAQIETDQGRRIVDLGNTEKLQDLDIRRGDTITAWGQTQKIRGNEVFMARKLQANGDKVFLDRPELAQQSGDQQRNRKPQEGQSRSGEQRAQKVRGEIIVAGEVVEFDRDTFDRDLFYIVKEPSGQERELIVAKGPALDQEFNVGDRIEARVRPDGTVTSITRISDEMSRESGGNQAGMRSDERGPRQDMGMKQQKGSGGPDHQAAQSQDQERSQR